MLAEQFPSELRELAALARDVATKKIAPLVRELETKRQFSTELRQILAEAGFFGIVVPAEFGGVESDVRAQTVIVEELAKVYPSATNYLTATWVPAKIMVGWARSGAETPAWLGKTLTEAELKSKLDRLAEAGATDFGAMEVGVTDADRIRTRAALRALL